MTIKICAALLVFSAGPAGAVVTSLPSPTFSWGGFGGGLAISGIRARQFVTPGGVAAGNLIQTVLQSIDQPGGAAGYRCNNGQTCAPAGSLSLQYALWKGSTTSNGPLNRVGAVLFGGFEPVAGNSGGYSFLQIYSDAASPGGIIDGGTATGKVNGDIPRYVSNAAAPATGWNYGGTAFDMFDVPFDLVGVSPAENVRFETALVRLGTTSVDIIADWTWGFSTLGPSLGGQAIAFQSAPSTTLLQLYAAHYAGSTYANAIAMASPAPEPATWGLLVLGFGLAGTVQRRQRTTRLG